MNTAPIMLVKHCKTLSAPMMTQLMQVLRMDDNLANWLSGRAERFASNCLGSTQTRLSQISNCFS